ncbi:DUF4097 family beta strand repeat-containing protein [Amycolatopsis carbonis]|uniref:DUF4097 family beta strand repeat-containing protein n=1 Tax=Amycolatopsis carbonis TaxID=715471 RepID=A0A9Y2IPG7_9PSEU|nr:DUF4097 family beta strand repeat-containing protein [Amycolatopsis sp. 2-15]WIX83567.1 DUF4097 family beta strand repeat-containing protein [Amycolatopsis sp. 2-15]
MSVFLRRVVVVAVVGVGLAGCSGGSGTTLPGHPLSYEDDTVVGGRITAVHLNTDAGNVEIDSRAGAKAVSVHRAVHNQSGRPVDATTRTEGGTLSLNGCEPQCAVDYTLVVPSGVTVDGATTVGSVSLTGLNGIDVTTENGDLTVRHVTAGPITLRSENGGIRGTDLGGSDIRAQSTNGGIDLAATTPQDIAAHLENGTLTLSVPNQPYAITATKQNGTISLGVPQDPAAAHHLDLGVENGEISVRPNGS